MSFINWGHETPEQKAARKRFEEDQAIFEQMMSAATAAAAAAAGGGGVGVRVPAYCGGEKVLREFIYFDFDLLTSNKFKPTDLDFETYDSLQEDLEGDFRADRDEYVKRENENALNLESGRISQIQPVVPFPEPTIYHKALKTSTPITRWKPVTEYAEWTTETGDPVATPAEKMPTVKYLNYLNEVEFGSDTKSLSGNPGDIVYAIDENRYYGWDPDAGEFSTDFYNTWMQGVAAAQRADRDAAAKHKNELILSTRPFLFASKYILDYKLKNKF
jgi:hypothetical protein